MYYSESFKINVSKMICFKILLLLFVINFVEAGRRLIGFNFKAVSPTGYQQCLKLCIGHADCLSVNFSRNQLQCELNSQHETDTVRVTENTEETEDFIYISKTSFPNVSFKGWGGQTYPKYKKNKLKKSSISLPVFAYMCEKGEGEGCVRYSYNFTTFMSDGYLTRIVLISRQPDACTCTCIKSKPNIETAILFVTTHMLCNTCTYSYS